MILKRDIKTLLRELDSYYNAEPHPRSTHYSKLALMELCGWIEESLDKIARRCVKNKILTTQYEDIMDSIVKNNYGFNYKRNFRKMMLQTIGVVKMEKLETQLNNTGKIGLLNATLDNLTIERNKAAHSTNAGVMLTFQAPSITLNQLEQIYPILRLMYSYAIKS
ncbi:hypothetical protein [Hwangdonia lutea]|uniref:RiboL-PSP-HEPN domain-containing protein n=1 Tax=Hwangdonia lutea TaxID=3075823 RepID=A0AA97EN32_9FLAO|nr:hypothetical protein [Hwangdonia sp. SCSIO 19198]WOD43475.1 hypothetical protein RNZ46_15910 [Hwangdonia sp. SCSIO 19198]